MKPGYKQTEVGVIPEDWEVKTISDVSSVKTGPFGSALHERDYVLDGTPIITVEHLSENGVIHKNLPLVSDADKTRLKSYILRKNDIVFSRVGSVDRNSLISKTENGWLFSGRLLRVRTSDKNIHPPYLSYCFHSEPFKKRVRNVAVGQTMASLNTQILNGINIVLPPFIEQRAIAAALSDVDALIESLDKLITKKRDIKQAAMQSLLIEKTRLPGYKGKWKEKRLGDGCTIITKGTTPTSIGKHFTESGVTFLKIEALNDNGKFIQDQFAFIDTETHRLLQRSQLQNGDLLISIAGALGRTGIVPKSILPANTNQALAIVRLSPESNLDGMFLYYSIKVERTQRHFRAISVQGAQANLSLKQISDIPICCPHKEEQTAIAEVLSDMDAEIAVLEKRRSKIRLLKQGMMQELLIGKTRLV